MKMDKLFPKLQHFYFIVMKIHLLFVLKEKSHKLQLNGGFVYAFYIPIYGNTVSLMH